MVHQEAMTIKERKGKERKLEYAGPTYLFIILQYFHIVDICCMLED